MRSGAKHQPSDRLAQLTMTVERQGQQIAALQARVDELVGDDALTVAQAADFACVSQQCIVDWIGRHGIGAWSDARRRYIVSKRKLIAFLIVRNGGADRLPYALRA